MGKETIIWKNRLSSTNRFLMEYESEFINGTVIATREQEAGLGLGKNKWVSQPGANLTFSYLLKPKTRCEASRQYVINMAVAVALFEFLSAQTDKKVSIKWPNDILIEGRKICGILIQHTLWGSLIHSSVIGVGLNVNQTSFPEFTPRATSLKLLTNNTFILEKMLIGLIEKMDEKLRMLAENSEHELKHTFLSNLYRYQLWKRYKIRGIEKTARIDGISAYGFLKLTDTESQQYECDLKEVVYLY